MAENKDLDAAINAQEVARKGKSPSWERWSSEVIAALERIIARNDDPEDKVQISAGGAKRILADLFDFEVSENTLRNYARQHLKRKAWSHP